MMHFENDNDRVNFIICLALLAGFVFGVAFSMIGYLLWLR
jgi:hypothetical protein